MKNTAIVIPKKGLNVPCPRTGQYLPAEGKRVSLSTYWTRRIADGSVTIKSEPENKKGGTFK